MANKERGGDFYISLKEELFTNQIQEMAPSITKSHLVTYSRETPFFLNKMMASQSVIQKKKKKKRFFWEKSETILSFTCCFQIWHRAYRRLLPFYRPTPGGKEGNVNVYP